MSAAARSGDLTSHGTPLTGPSPGSPDVFIGGMPAWRVGDFHQCPLMMPPSIPHVGGNITMGSTTVMINNKPAARQGDMIAESAGPPNSISMGCMTVMIG